MNDVEVGKGREDILALLENLTEMDLIIQAKSGEEALSLYRTDDQLPYYAKKLDWCLSCFNKWKPVSSYRDVH